MLQHAWRNQKHTCSTRICIAWVMLVLTTTNHTHSMHDARARPHRSTQMLVAPPRKSLLQLFLRRRRNPRLYIEITMIYK